MRSNCVLRMAGAAILAACFAAAAQAQKDGDWPMYRHDPASTGYSALKQINTGNVTTLAQAWTMRLNDRGGLEVTPIAVNGVMYFPAGNKVLAVDPETGKEIWHYELPASQASSRGVAFWPGDATNAPRILFTTLDRKLIALDAATGKLVPNFATGGVAELTVGYNGIPTIFKNIALLGASVGELPKGPAGDTRAYDAITGQLLWTFHTVARPGETGHETWLDNGWDGRSGTNVWGWYMTADEKTNTVYMPMNGTNLLPFAWQPGSAGV